MVDQPLPKRPYEGTAWLEATKRVGHIEIEDVPEPTELKRQLSETPGQDRAP